MNAFEVGPQEIDITAPENPADSIERDGEKRASLLVDVAEEVDRVMNLPESLRQPHPLRHIPSRSEEVRHVSSRSQSGFALDDQRVPSAFLQEDRQRQSGNAPARDKDSWCECLGCAGHDGDGNGLGGPGPLFPTSHASGSQRASVLEGQVSMTT